MSPNSAYQPFRPARRPGIRPVQAPRYRVLVHRKFFQHWMRMESRVGLGAAQELWDHLAFNPGQCPEINGSCILKGSPGRPQGPGWSRTIHYELSSKARVNYQFHDTFAEGAFGDAHPVVAILTIDYKSHSA